MGNAASTRRCRGSGRWQRRSPASAFASGRAPCIGPVLGSVHTVAATRGWALEGAGLLAAYSAGLVVFLAAGVAFGRLVAVFRNRSAARHRHDHGPAHW